MKILALETTGPRASVAYLDTETGLADQLVALEDQSHLQSLLPMADELLKKHGSSINDVTEIAVSRGPGSFTGIRIGMTAARTLAQVLNVPVVPVPTLETFLYNLPAEATPGRLICPLFDARRSQVYAAALEWVNGKPVEVIAEGAYSIEEYLDLVEGYLRKNPDLTPLFYGDGLRPYGKNVLDRFADAFCAPEADEAVLPAEDVLLAPEVLRYQTALSVALAALNRIEEGKTVSWQDAHPEYLRKAEAERKMDEAREAKIAAAAAKGSARAGKEA
ncbi:MAG: tRNA (adenosine(37)-N6)-threonylcarbamoyltransferase complex dimerization subunit type 1 TsaB [Clostridiales bacterium]|nr:tRNA (adenosine(37)-N6)-threonylcarbamoyltransferase complex dimerization subunit type 1 TsaB [Clostridiales bacterium]